VSGSTPAGCSRCISSSLASAVLYGAVGAVATRYDARLLQSGALAVRGASFPGLVLVAGIGAGAVDLAGAGLGLVVIGVTRAVIAVVGTAIVTRLARLQQGEQAYATIYERDAEPLAAECRAFVDRVRGDRSPTTDGAFAVDVHRVLDRVRRDSPPGNHAPRRGNPQ